MASIGGASRSGGGGGRSDSGGGSGGGKSSGRGRGRAAGTKKIARVVRPSKAMRKTGGVSKVSAQKKSLLDQAKSMGVRTSPRMSAKEIRLAIGQEKIRRTHSDAKAASAAKARVW